MTQLASIIIPCYNAEKFIAETIESVLNQTYSNWELIIIDDGSKDNSSKIITSFLTDSRIKYYYQENKGVSTARNNGISKVNGVYIAFLDADDVWTPTNLEEKINELQSDTIDYVFSNKEHINEDSSSMNIFSNGTDVNLLHHFLLWDRTVIPGPASNLIVKRKCLDSGLRFDPTFSTAADQDFCFNLAAKYTGKLITKPLFKYRILTNSMSRNIATMEKDHIAVYKKAARNNLFKSFLFKQQCFSNLYLVLAGSWWKDGKNKIKGLYFIFLSLITYPPQAIKLAQKISHGK
ncbi:MAG: glycosyltransferase [Flavobacteriales bacterium]|nr:glycosyltransferase [Flavobacteriales bacterium]